MSETTNTRDTTGPLPYPSRDVDRSKWTSGPWDDEPDVETWTDGASGLHCAILRMPRNGQLNGYVAVPAGSSLDGCSYSDKIVPPPEFISREVNIDEDVGVIPLVCAAVLIDEDSGTYAIELLARCHGGLTYSDRSSDGLWWFGFDTGHYMDAHPYDEYGVHRSGAYRDFEYMKQQCTKLAGDLAAINAAIAKAEERTP